MTASICCFSLEDFRLLQPSEEVAVIAIGDVDRPREDLSAWGPSISPRFADADFDAAYIARWGWVGARDAGCFTPELAISIRRFLSCDVVRECKGLFVVCPSGRSRSFAVGLFAEDALRWPLAVPDTSDANATVLQLLRSPRSLETAQSDLGVPARSWWREPFRWVDRVAALRSSSTR